ncbi:venom allergen 5 2-like isoform X2 [Diabrotica undecimpunctata]|uniref:venom allergen 5 2-like isoform X2 n=1 Tax=Diabrotica undecimpunctata TaxID=50387 RepID=UPI003B638175
MYLYRSIFYIYFTISLCSFEDPMNYLSIRKNREWFKNVTQGGTLRNRYCSVCCIDTSKEYLTKICGKHTMCLYPKETYGSGCKGVLDIPFAQEEIDAIVDAHNTIRNRVALGLEYRGNPGPQPQASNMREIEWNSELANTAQRWASQCIYAHDICRDSDKYPVGQNIARGTFATNYDISFIAGWYKNIQWINASDVLNYQNTSLGAYQSYTQLIWADTYEIGCARIVFENGYESNVSYHEHFICNYGPTGNIRGQPIYKIGTPCLSCPEGTGCSITYSGLCQNEFSYEIEDRPFNFIKNENRKNISYIKAEFRNCSSKYHTYITFSFIFLICCRFV